MFRKYGVFAVCFVALLVLIACYLRQQSRYSRFMREQIMIRNSLQSIYVACYPETYGTAIDNIYSPSGYPLLSWRVRILKESPDDYSRSLVEKFDTDAAWNSEPNIQYLNYRPAWCYYPYYIDNSQKTCIVGIQEIMQHRQKHEVNDIIKDKAMIIVVAPEYAVNWSEPIDISWKDLANNNIKPYWSGNAGDYVFYIRAGDCKPLWKPVPKTMLEWQELCGLTKEEETILNGSLKVQRTRE